MYAGTINRAGMTNRRSTKDERRNIMNTKNERTLITNKINKLQKRHPGTRRQRSYHGCGRYSVQFFSKRTGELVADYNL